MHNSKTHDKLNNSFLKSMAWKFIVKDLLLIVSWIGSVITYTTIPDNSSYIFNKLIKNLKFR